MKLFKRTTSTRTTPDSNEDDVEIDEGVAPSASVSETSDDAVHDLHDMHGDLDDIEAQLASLRVRQKSLLDVAMPVVHGAPAAQPTTDGAAEIPADEPASTTGGTVTSIDLTSLSELADLNQDDDFDRRFADFVSVGDAHCEASRRWIEAL